MMHAVRPAVHSLAATLALSLGTCGSEDPTPAPTAQEQGQTPSTPDPAHFAVTLTGEPIRTERRDSGLVVEIFADGAGQPLRLGETGVVSFEMRLASDGRVIQSSAQRRSHLWVPMIEGRAIPGLIEGLEGMRTGEKRRLRVPHRLAYAEAGRPPVPARADLVFDIELVEIAEHE